MPQVEYNGIMFDSDLEIRRYKELTDGNIPFIYQREYKRTPFKIGLEKRKNYTPDFIEIYDDYIMITETKGYIIPQLKFLEDKIKNKIELLCATNDSNLREWIESLGIRTKGKSLKYQRIKYISSFGWVDYDWKNPNTRAKKQSEKIKLQKEEIKELENFKKNTNKYFEYLRKMNNGEKLTKTQKLWYSKYCVDNNIATEKVLKFYNEHKN